MKNYYDLFERNHPRQFWKIADAGFTDDDWSLACKSAITHLDNLVPSNLLNNDPIQHALRFTLGEERLGIDHWELSMARKIFYQLKPFIPKKIQSALHKTYQSKRKFIQDLKWPIEERYVIFQFELLRTLLKNKGVLQIPYIHFWPHKKRFAFVLTHDVETESGFRFIPRIVELEKQYDFHSLFNIVPEKYPINKSYLETLRAEGFEIGIHGLKHDGKLFRTQKVFLRRTKKINDYLHIYSASGFRAPLMHRHPLWMQALKCEYDLSFFDTDPYESIPGGCMSIWPFFIGHFVELPYTLVQDHTLMLILNEISPKLWLEKIDFIERYYGMALLNLHPDYIGKSDSLKIYEALLKKMSEKKEYFWNALPIEVTRWWKARDNAVIEINNNNPFIQSTLPGSSVGTIALLNDNTLQFSA